MPTLFVRTLIVYTLMFTVLRLMGKRQISDMQPFDLAVTLLIANLASIPMSDPTTPLLYGVIPIIGLFVVHRLVSFAALKSERIRGVVCGSPLFIISKGTVLEDVMRAANYSLDDLTEQLRLKDVFSVSLVEYAILETNGSLSVLLKSGAQTPTNGQLGVAEEKVKPALMLVADGRPNRDALRSAGVDEKKLRSVLGSLGVGAVEDCLYASVDADGVLTAQKKLKRRGEKAEAVSVRIGGEKRSEKER